MESTRRDVLIPREASDLNLRPDRFKVAPRGKAKSKGGTNVSWHDSAPANSVHFSGRLVTKPLHPGHYRLKMVAALSGLHSVPLTKPFAVARSHN